MKKKTAPSSSGKSPAKKQKQPTQKPTAETVMIVGPTGKRRFEKRPW